MSDYTFTKKGAEWAANRMISSKYTKDIDTMYVVYTNGSTERLDLTNTMTVSDLLNQDNGIWCMKKEGGVVGYVTDNGNGQYIANMSCVVTKDDVVSGGSVVLSSNASKVIAVAVAVSGEPDTIIAVCNMTKSGVANPIRWVDNMSMSVSCPICLSPYPQENE